MAFCYVGLGGNRRQTRRGLRVAARLLRKIPSARMTGLSRVFVSRPLGCPGSQPDYLNAAAGLQTFAPPLRIFRCLRRIERCLQKRRRRRNAPRILDADYLSHGAAVMRGRFLRLPHPRMTGRAFVLEPLSELAGRRFTGLRRASTMAKSRAKLTTAQGVFPSAKGWEGKENGWKDGREGERVGGWVGGWE